MNGEKIDRLVSLKNCDEYTEILPQAYEFYHLLNLDKPIRLEVDDISIYMTKTMTINDLVRTFEHEYFLTTGIMVE